MKIKVLGSFGREGVGQRPSAFLVDDRVLVDAGTVGGALSVAEQVEIQAKYEGYIERQRGEVARRAESESRALPADLDYRQVRGLSAEAQQKLDRYRPETLGQAARIQGMTPAAISLLLVHLKRGFRPLDKKRA